MKEAPISHDETMRLEALQAMGVLDTPPEERFDRITRLAQRLFGVPIALVSLIDQDRQWFKSHQGLDVEETPLSISFCGHAVLDDALMVVPDAMQDERFRDNPLVIEEPHVRFYAGAPLRAADGSRVGTLCVIDHEPRDLGHADSESLRDLANMVEHELAVLELATLDDLTGLMNRRGFDAIANKSLALCHQWYKNATLLFLDLDDFKQINDTLGHATGDRVLRSIAAFLKEAFRESDAVARLGGDEFCVLLSGASPAQVERPLARLEDRVRRYNRRARDHQVSFSFGFASYDPNAPMTLAEMQRVADSRMYEHKRERRRAW
jgi:diguanylate cyclase (GGDEF)-like protein